MAKAISYVRFSSGSQASGSTLLRQQEKINAWLENNPNVFLSNLSREDLGRSGYTGENLKHGLGDIIAAIEEGKIRSGDFLLIEAIDRFGRQPELVMLDIFQRILKKGVNIVSLDDGETYSQDGLNQNGYRIYQLIGKISQANTYSKNLSTRILAANEFKRIRAREGQKVKLITPYWLDNYGNIIQKRAKPVLFCVEKYLKGYGTLAIFKELVKIYPDLKDIHPKTITRWIRSPAIAGDWKANGEIIEDVFEPLVDRVTYLKISQQVKIRRKESKKKGVYLTAGLVKCRLCEKNNGLDINFHYRRKEYKGDVIVYSHCSSYLKKSKAYCENNKSWPYEVLLAILEETYEESLEGFTKTKVTEKLSLEYEDKKEELKALSIKRGKAYDLLVESSDDDTFYKEKLKEIEQECKAVSKRILDIESAIKEEGRKELSIQDLKSADALFGTIAINQVHLRESLSAACYMIKVGRYCAFVVQKKHAYAYALVKRSQKYKCYVIKKRVMCKEYELNSKRSWSSYYAIDRVGVLCIGKSYSDLTDKLQKRAENIKSGNICNDEIIEDQVYLKVHGTFETSKFDSEGFTEELVKKLASMSK